MPIALQVAEYSLVTAALIIEGHYWRDREDIST